MNLSLGVLLFVMITGCQPFRTNKPGEMDLYWEYLNDKQYDQYQELYQQHQINPPNEFKELIAQLLNPNPDERIDLNTLIQNQWLNQDTIPIIQKMPQTPHNSIIDIKKNEIKYFKNCRLNLAYQKYNSPHQKYINIDLKFLGDCINFFLEVTEIDQNLLFKYKIDIKKAYYI